MKNSQCKQTKSNGERCRANAVSGSKFCFWHSPGQESARKKARQRGGRARMQPKQLKTLSSDAPNAKIKSADDVVALLSETINQVLRGEVDPKVANTVGYLSGIILRAREQGDIEERIVELETAVKNGGRGKVTRLRPSA